MAREEWRLCADWLVRCKILAADHKVTWPHAEVFDLAQTLRDGVLICHLLNALKPGAIDLKDFSQRPQMSQFLCLKNIRTFLQTCRSVFGMRDSDLFDSYDLFDMKDFGKVINTLSKLSKSTESVKSGISGFPASNAAVKRDCDYYNTLEELATKVEIGGEFEPIYEIQTVDDEEDIYGEIVYGRLGTISSRSKEQRRPSLSSSFQPQTQRDYCIKELVETERNYVDALNMVVTHFIRPLKSVLAQTDSSIIFLGIEQLMATHTAFHSELHKACTQPSGPTIGDCFIKYKKQFLIYGDFCSNLPQAQEKVDELCKRSQIILEKINDCQMKANDGKFRLRDLLSVPMQRVLKYHLLLQELKKKTDENHPERKSLEKALEAMQDLSWYVNEVKRDNETLLLINEIERSIVDLHMPENTALRDYGKLLKDGELKVKSHGDNKTRTRYIFLFDKVMLMCKSRGESYSFKNALNLSQHRIEENNAGGRQKQQWSFCFLLAEIKNSTAYTFYAKTEEMKRKWIDAISMALDNVTPHGARDRNHEFVMHSFNEPVECDVCEKLLRGVFYQGYRCQACHKCAHKECLSKARPCGLNTSAPNLPPRRESGILHRPPPTPIRPEPRISIGKCKTNYSYKGIPEPSDGRAVITFEVGEIIDLLSDEDEHWWEGRIQGREGFFPAQYVTKHRVNERGRRRSYEPVMGAFAIPPPRLETRRSSSTGSENGLASPLPGSPSYVNMLDLTPYQWYVGEMAREVAMHRLEKHVSGTYLVRTSNNPTRKGEYSLSIKYGSSVKHIKVNRTPDSMYYLADCKLFRSIPELVEYYQTNSLENSFPELDTVLSLGYKDAVRQSMNNVTSASAGPVIQGYCVANFDYAANQPNQLSLKRGDRVAIISKAGEDRGWWKGQLRGKTGYFPLAYVTEETDDNNLQSAFLH